MFRLIILLYGFTCYALFVAVFAYLIGFTGNLVVPKGVDEGSVIAWPAAVAVDAALMMLFGLQHSVMARAGFKRWWSRLVPPPAERSTYVLASSLVLVLLFALWQPLPLTVWQAEADWLRGVLWAGFFAGWGTLLCATFLIDHFDLFGLRQVWDHFHGTQSPLVEFKTPGLYRWVRHPMMTGFLLGFWCVPEMSAGHLLLATGMTSYIIVGTSLEERSLIAAFGERYRRYRERVPRLFPLPGRSAARAPRAARDEAARRA